MVRDSPGAWGGLLKTIAGLSSPSTLIFVTYTDRGHNKLWDRFVAQRVTKLFHVVRVASHLLHPHAHSGAAGRLPCASASCPGNGGKPAVAAS